MSGEQKPPRRSFWARLFWPFEISTEYESVDDSDALKLRGKNPLSEEESVRFDDSNAD